MPAYWSCCTRATTSAASSSPNAGDSSWCGAGRRRRPEPVRSLLFIPADDERKLAKGPATGADALILDLEDAVSESRKGAARGLASEFIKSSKAQQGRPTLYVRINALDTAHWQDDLAGIMSAGPDGILLPKARSGEDVHKLSIALHHAEE